MPHLFFMVVISVLLGGFGPANSQNIEAGSWGGKVRSGPGMNFRQVGSLQNGDPVQLLERTREHMNGYDWWRISFANGQIGYQWGGILCGYGGRIDGVFEVCDRDNRVNRVNQTPNKPTDPRHATCDTLRNTASRNSDVPVTITFVNRSGGYRSVQWIGFDGQPKEYAALNNGQKFTINTFLTHPWMFTDGPGNCIEMHMPQQGVRTFEITAPARNFGPE